MSVMSTNISYFKACQSVEFVKFKDETWSTHKNESSIVLWLYIYRYALWEKWWSVDMIHCTCQLFVINFKVIKHHQSQIIYMKK